MHLSSLLLCLGLGVLVKCDAGSDWCYTGCVHTPSHWGELKDSNCDGKRQSPIDIVTSHVKVDHNLDNFTIVNFTSEHVIKSISNTGHTVKCILEDNEVEVSGGGLNGTYSTIQFHFHWGCKEGYPGSEHMIDGHRYPMEMHIVSLKKGLDVSEAKADPTGIAVLGFFINATEDENMSEPWSNLTNYLTNITDNGSEINVTDKISIQELIGNVDLTKFFRYMGSLTTPDCSEAVVWTVFQEPININKELNDACNRSHLIYLTAINARQIVMSLHEACAWLRLVAQQIQQFTDMIGVHHVYRPTQNLNERPVYASNATVLPSHHWCYDAHCFYSPPHWQLLPESHCGGERQSPINIDTEDVVMDEHLDAFAYTNFDDKLAFKYITNTGHTVKCVMKDDMVEVSGGGLGYVYSTLQLHFHWGSTSHDSEGSEHMVDSHRYPMEMHIVNRRKDLTLEEALKTPNGLAVLGFFIEATDITKAGDSDHGSEQTNPTSDMDAWKKLTHYLSAVQNISSEVEFTEELSIDDLLGDVNRESYYRYNGSLTTPTCNEAVVWTVFKESIKVDKDLMMMFPTKTGYHDVYRPPQGLHNRKIYTTASSARPGPITLLLLLACLCAFSYNLHL